MKIYLVGGAVRDQLLELPWSERDWVVVGADEQQMLDLGYRRADALFPVFLHPESGEEYALARTETKAGRGYKGFEVQAGPEVTLEQDLARRDLTINAMALDEEGRVIDPFGGREDLDAGLLRHVTPAFVEDPLRLLRVARFAARLGRWGFRVAHGTHGLMKKMATPEELATLSPERQWRELRKALESDQPWRYFEVLHRCGALPYLIPELATALGEPGAHAEAAAADPLAGLKRLCADAEAASWSMRFAAAFWRLVPDAEIPELAARLRVERDGLERLQLAQRHVERFEAAAAGDAAAAAELLQQTRALQHPQRFADLLRIWGASLQAPAEAVQRLQRALAAAEGVSTVDLQAQGLAGPELGRALQQARQEAIRRAL